MTTLILCFVYLFRKVREWLRAREAVCVATA